ncbi:MAG TPA: NAD-binding protein, partial [Armatimonadota bacterium]|nr:NAD-binding protein [Armatimonadota bacterium]
ALASTLLSMVREVVFGVGFALLLPLFFGLDGVLYSMPAADVFTFVISAAVIRRTLRSLADMDAILAQITEGKVERALVIGGGFIGLELTEALRERGIGVTLVELAPQVMAPLDPEMAAP